MEQPTIEHATPEATVLWRQFVHENNKRQKYTAHHALPVFSGIVKITTNSNYHTLHDLQRTLELSNKQCAQFYAHPQLHMSLAYINIPLEIDQFNDEHEMIGQLTRDLVRLLDQFAATLQTVTFEYESTKILGKNNNFIVAAFNPEHGIADLQDTFILPFGQELFKKYPHAWFGFLENPTFHISLAKLKPGCNAHDITIPRELPPVDTYHLKTGTLKVSLHGPTRKPYYKKVRGWHQQKFKT